MQPPRAERRSHVHTEHGVERVDPYHWMRDREDPALTAYLEAENAYTAATTAHLEPLRETLFEEMLGRIQEDDDSVPTHREGWWYYSRTESGRPYPVHCRKRGSLEAPEEIILDVNALAEGKDYLDLGAVTVSRDHRTLAYAVDDTGRELYRVHFLDLETGELHPDTIEDVWPDLAWATDHRTLLYTVLDDSLRPHEVRRHTLGEAHDAVVLHEEDDRFRVGVHRTRDDRWLVVSCDSASTSEAWLLPADTPTAELQVFSTRHEGCEYAIASLGDRFVVLTDDSDDDHGVHDKRAVNFKLMTAALGATDRASWTELIAHREAVTLLDVDAFADHLVITEREQGQSYLRYRTHDGRTDRRVAMPESTYVLGGASNPDFHSGAFRFTYTSLTVPPSTYDVDLATGALTLLKRQPVLGGYDPEAYVAERLYATAPDGVAVPISMVRRRDTPVDGTAPLLLYGYGAYGITIEPRFSSVRLSQLDRGVIFAIAHIRGGGFLGRTWKEAGKFEHKQNTFSDFIAAGRHLVAEGFTTHDRMAIQGGSAGGLLIGAVLNQAPDLAAHAVAQVPFVDVVSTMLDASIPLTTNEWEEWGDPRQRRWFDVMHAYSPYDQVRQGPYPNLLITSGLEDPRVQYWEPTKWIARLRDRVSNGSQLLLKMEMGAGHGGKTGRYGMLEDAAWVHAWLLDRWGIADGAASVASAQ